MARRTRLREDPEQTPGRICCFCGEGATCEHGYCKICQQCAECGMDELDLAKAIPAPPSSVEGAQEELMKNCPTCDSPAPHLHPAIQYEGEVQICGNVFHQRETPQNTRFKSAQASVEGAPERCPSCGYTEEDAKFHMDHHLCNYSGKAPWEKSAAGAGVEAERERCVKIVRDWFDSLDEGAIDCEDLIQKLRR